MHTTGQHCRNFLPSYVYYLSFWLRLKWENKGICGGKIFWNANWYFPLVFPFISRHSSHLGIQAPVICCFREGMLPSGKSLYRLKTLGPDFIWSQDKVGRAIFTFPPETTPPAPPLKKPPDIKYMKRWVFQIGNTWQWRTVISVTQEIDEVSFTVAPDNCLQGDSQLRCREGGPRWSLEVLRKWSGGGAR